MAKLTQREKDDRATARRWGLSAKSNLDMALWAEGQANDWRGLEQSLLKWQARRDPSTEAADSTTSAIEHARGRIAYFVELADHQTNQVKLNTRRAATVAIRTRDGRS